jgi:hypothetical protein
MNGGRVEEERGGKETDGCPLTGGGWSWSLGIVSESMTERRSRSRRVAVIIYTPHKPRNAPRTSIM